MAEFLIIAGRSGAGRSEVAKSLDDLGWFVIDNLPTPLISKVAELVLSPGSIRTHVALVVGSEGPGDTMAEIIDLQKDARINTSVLYLTADEETLIRRYEESRRRHPYGGAGSLRESILAESEAIETLREAADVEIDTSDLNVHQLGQRIEGLFAVDPQGKQMQIRLVSFGYKHGLPTDVDLVMDCRFLPNPYWVKGLKELTGMDNEVREFILNDPIAQEFLIKLTELLELLLPAYQEEGKSYLSLAVGCTGGQHRSVMIVNELETVLAELNYPAKASHRDLSG
ncbi:MAG: RNase adapter RapZ [Acidimicrobiaceae bacterium]|nr:RNase adapter RapZ [Acidimicrobiaceae bacterium]